MDVKGIPKASPQGVARQKRILGVAVVAGAAALYWVINHSEETKKPIEKVRNRFVATAAVPVLSKMLIDGNQGGRTT